MARRPLKALGSSMSDPTLAKVTDLTLEFVTSQTSDSSSNNNEDIIYPSQVVQYIQKRDFQLMRMKKLQITKLVEVAIQQVREMQLQDHTEQEIADNKDKDKEDVAQTDSNTNNMNRSVVDLWKVDNGNCPAPEDDDTRSPDPANATGTKKRRRGGVDSSTTNNNPKKSKKEKLARDPPMGIRLADLGGMSSIIKRLKEECIIPVRHPELYTALGDCPETTFLFYGPHGCGKTTLANALAAELQIPYISISATDVISGMSGGSEQNVRDIFDEAKQLAPCMLFIDEIDSLTPKRDGGSDRQMDRRVVAELGKCIDSLNEFHLETSRAVILIAATSRPDYIDASLRQSGRFSNEISIGVPDDDARYQIIQTLCRTKKLRLSPDFDFRAVVKMTPGFVGADLRSLIKRAVIASVGRVIKDLINNQMHSMDLDKDDDEDKDNLFDLFISQYPEKLDPQLLENTSVTIQDFLTGLPQVQPSSKRDVMATIPNVSWSDIGALAPVRAKLQMAIVQPIKRPEYFAGMGISVPSGVLMWGPPGCGKTLLAKAVANECGANFISIKGPELLNKYVGESERSLRHIFTRARATKPCIVFFDEIDALVPRRDGDSNSDASNRVVTTLLTELDGFDARNGVFVIGATNRPDTIDRAMLRQGRFGTLVMVELPTPDERVDILKTLCRKTPLADDVDLEKIGLDLNCSNFSGADLSALIYEACILAMQETVFLNVDLESEDKYGMKDLRAGNNNNNNNIIEAESKAPALVKMRHFNAAFSRVHNSVTDRDMNMYNKMKKQFTSQSS